MEQNGSEIVRLASSSPPQHLAEPTLLPPSIANTVSLVTRSTSLSLRLGTLIGGLVFDGARVVTLTALEVSRSVLEGILSRAGGDVASGAAGDLGRVEAEGILEKSLATLHTTITGVSFAASSGFHFSAAVLGSATDVSQQLLAALDSVLGSTDSSRAISSIITLIRREFQNPATGREGEKVGVADLLVGIIGLVLLQRWSQRLADAERMKSECDQVVWDVVVLENWMRADVLESTEESGLVRMDSPSVIAPAGQEVSEISLRLEDSDDDLPEIKFRQSILKSLPESAHVSITTSTTMTRTVTVEITGADVPDLRPPPGVEIIEESADHSTTTMDNDQDTTIRPQIAAPHDKFRVVYRILRNKMVETDVTGLGIAIEESRIVGQDEEIAKAPSIVKTAAPTSIDYGVIDIVQPMRDPHTSESIERTDIQPNLKDKSIPLPITKDTKHVMNQRKVRKPLSISSSTSESSEMTTSRKSLDGPEKPKPAKKIKTSRPELKVTKEKGSFRNALRKGSGSGVSSLWSKDSHSAAPAQGKSTPQLALNGTKPESDNLVKAASHGPPSNSTTSVSRSTPRVPQRGSSAKDTMNTQLVDMPRTSSRTSYYSVHERRRDSIVSQMDTYSIHSIDTQPGSPTAFGTELKAQSNLLRARSEKNITRQPQQVYTNHRRATSQVPSIYTLKSNDSVNSLVIAHRPHRSAFEELESLDVLMRTGEVEGMFPQHHIVRNISRFVRFASASYGANFLRVMGIPSASTTTQEVDISYHHEHYSFSRHTQLPADTILLSSHVDPQGGTDSSGLTNTGIPMVHFVSLDHESKAVVLTCRGTLGFEDVLTDMTCDYDTVIYQGNNYLVHKGIHASAQRLLDGKGSRVMATIKAALEEFPEYGLVLCGHSLGGGVTALLAVLISEPSVDSSSFVTASSSASGSMTLRLPPGRPIHVFAYGPPATFSPRLRLATRGLITTIVHGQDLVPYLSLGVLHDLQAVSLAFKTDDSGAKGEVRSRIWAGLKDTFASTWYRNLGESDLSREQDDQWAYAALKSLRASMLSAKLLPPGEVFVLETMPVLQRYAFTLNRQTEGGGNLGRPATRTVLRYIRDVEKRFGEIQFGGSMLLDHSPGRYERSLAALSRGVLE